MILKEQMMQHPQCGLFIQIVDSPALLLMAKQAGMDFVFFDCEHGSIPYERLNDLMLMGNEIALPSLVRVPELSRAWVSRILDFGAEGVMVPMIETKEQAEKLVQWSKYPPIGERSYSGGGHTKYGPSGNHSVNMESDNRKVLSIVQIETRKGVENIDEILSVQGVDAAIIGPCDLSISIGHPDDMFTEEELRMIDSVADTCAKYHKGFGIIGGNKMLKMYKEKLNLLISAIDAHLLRDALKQARKEYDETM